MTVQKWRDRFLDAGRAALATDRLGGPATGESLVEQRMRLENEQLKLALPKRPCSCGSGRSAPTSSANGHSVSDSTIERAMRRRGLLLPPGFRADHRTMARVRRQVIVEPATRRNRVWQMDFSEFGTLGGGIRRLCAVVEYHQVLPGASVHPDQPRTRCHRLRPPRDQRGS
jgi:hypothetical protein